MVKIGRPKIASQSTSREKLTLYCDAGRHWRINTCPACNSRQYVLAQFLYRSLNLC